MSEVKYIMVVDQRRCMGCHTCVIACKVENNMPSGINMNNVLTEGSKIVDIPYGSIPMTSVCTMDDFNRVTGTQRIDYITQACQHCADAPCVKACPTGATWQREDGIVAMNSELCIGCDNCRNACLYSYGNMRVHIQSPTFDLNFATGDQKAPKTVDGIVKKCTFCAHRVDMGEQPFCVSQCPARARYFGDMNNSGSDVAILMATRDFKNIPPDMGKTATEPSVYFLKP